MLFESLNENRIEMLQYIRIQFTIKTPRLNTINVLSHKECEENLHIYKFKVENSFQNSSLFLPKSY